MYNLEGRVLTYLLALAILAGCSAGKEYSIDPDGNRIELPNCKEYIGQFSTISIRWDILKKYTGEITVSAGIKSALQNDRLQHHYALQAENLCTHARTYISSGEKQQYFCRDERLSNSVTQIEMINTTLERLTTPEEAQAIGDKIIESLNHFFEKFFNQLSTPCSSPPLPLSISEIREALGEEIRKSMKGVEREIAQLREKIYTTQRIEPSTKIIQYEVDTNLGSFDIFFLETGPYLELLGEAFPDPQREPPKYRKQLWALDGNQKKLLGLLVSFLGKHSEITVQIEGHVGSRVSSLYALLLGEQRATAVKDFLKNKGVLNEMSVISYGKERPFSTDPEAEDLSNRVHFVFIPPTLS